MTYLDHSIKEELKIKHYFRYCDNITILAKDKYALHKCLEYVKIYLNKNLKLSLKGNYQIYNIKEGVDFLGYRFFKTYTLLRKKIVVNFKRVVRIKPLALEKVASYYGWIISSSSYNLWVKYFGYNTIKQLNKGKLCM